jgi:hypothetical protein
MSGYHILRFEEIFEEKVTTRKGIVDYLEDGYVKFVYFKAGGERRTAFGTLKGGFIDRNFEYSDAPKDDKSRNSQKATDEMGYIKYYDLERHGFRMFKIDNNVYFKEFYRTLADLIEAYPKFRKEFSDYKRAKDELDTKPKGRMKKKNKGEEATEE